jgi:hypothetical protein
MMSHRLLLLTLVPLLAATAQAQVVQLPSMHTFSIRTSVLVPDRGGTYLGGVNRAAHGSTSRGAGWSPLGRNVGRGGTVAGTGVMVHATIIDHAELDEMVLEEARAMREVKGLVDADTSRPRIAPPRDSAATSVAAIKRELAAEDDAMEAEAKQDFEKAVAYERAGEGALARNYYRVAARKSTGEIKQKSLQRLAALAAASKSTTKSR